MSDALTFTVDGEPTPKGRARTRVVTTKSGKSFATHYTPSATAAYERKVREVCGYMANVARWTWTDGDRFAVELRVYRTHEGKGGDLDNYAKAICDAINGVAFPDDRYVRALRAELLRDAARPRVEVCVMRLARETTTKQRKGRVTA